MFVLQLTCVVSTLLISGEEEEKDISHFKENIFDKIKVKVV